MTDGRARSRGSEELHAHTSRADDLTGLGSAAQNLSALRELTDWLRQQGRTAEADRIRRYGLDACGRTAGPGG